jgi:predicted nuclease with TOPRIM domain
MPPLQLLLGEKLDVPLSSSGGPFSGTTAAGAAVAADVLLMATGITTNSRLMAKQLPDALDEQGRIKVRRNPSLDGAGIACCRCTLLHGFRTL